MNVDEKFMARALDLARQGRGAVEPNPMVGCVIVRDGKVLGEGWHQRFGGPHAEVEALAAAKRAGADVRGATVYVTLEPCCHQGKTPPCTQALIQAGVARVAAAMQDPDHKVAGKGFTELKNAGIQVQSGVMEKQARHLLAAYIKLRTQGLPWVICKWAQTADGYLALPAGKDRWVSGPEARAHVHELRSYCDGICVGSGTVLADDPLLTNRSGRGKQPVRVVLDANLRTAIDCQLLKTIDDSPVLIATTSEALARSPAHARRLRKARAEILELPPSTEGIDLHALLAELGRRQWTYLLVEGGAAVLASFIGGGLADEIMTFVSPQHLDEPRDLPLFDIADVREQLGLPKPRQTHVGKDLMLHWEHVHEP